MKSTEPTWFKKYRDDYLAVSNILRNTDAEELVSNMEWFDDKVISEFRGSSYDLLRAISFRNRANLQIRIDKKQRYFSTKLKTRSILTFCFHYHFY